MVIIILSLLFFYSLFNPTMTYSAIIHSWCASSVSTFCTSCEHPMTCNECCWKVREDECYLVKFGYFVGSYCSDNEWLELAALRKNFKLWRESSSSFGEKCQTRMTATCTIMIRFFPTQRGPSWFSARLPRVRIWWLILRFFSPTPKQHVYLRQWEG